LNNIESSFIYYIKLLILL